MEIGLSKYCNVRITDPGETDEEYDSQDWDTVISFEVRCDSDCSTDEAEEAREDPTVSSESETEKAHEEK